MVKLISAIALLIIGCFVWAQTKKPIEHRALVFDDPWGPLIYMISAPLGIYLLWDRGWKIIIGVWFLSLIMTLLLIGIFEKFVNKE